MFLKSEGGEKMELPGKDYSFYAKQWYMVNNTNK